MPLLPAARRNIPLIAAHNFCLDFRIYNAIAVLYFQTVTGSFALALTIISLAKVSSAFFEVPTGVFSDLIGRKYTLVLGQVGSTLSIVSYAAAGSFDLLAVGAILEGFASALFSGNNDALLYETLRQEKSESAYAEYQGRLSSMFQAGLAISALVASGVLHLFSFRFLFWLSVVPQLAGLVVTFFIVEPKVHDRSVTSNIFSHVRDAWTGFLRDRRLRLVSSASILGFAIGETKFQFLPAFFALLWPPWAVALARFGSHALAALGFVSGGRLVGRWGESPVLLGASAARIATGVASTLMANLASPGLYCLASFAFGPEMIAQASAMQKSFTDRQRATMGSLNALGGSVAFAIAAILIGFWADRVGPRFALLTAEFLSISVLYLYWRLFASDEARRRPNDVEDQSL